MVRGVVLFALMVSLRPAFAQVSQATLNGLRQMAQAPQPSAPQRGWLFDRVDHGEVTGHYRNDEFPGSNFTKGDDQGETFATTIRTTFFGQKNGKPRELEIFFGNRFVTRIRKSVSQEEVNKRDPGQQGGAAILRGEVVPFIKGRIPVNFYEELRLGCRLREVASPQGGMVCEVKGALGYRTTSKTRTGSVVQKGLHNLVRAPLHYTYKYNERKMQRVFGEVSGAVGYEWHPSDAITCSVQGGMSFTTEDLKEGSFDGRAEVVLHMPYPPRGYVNRRRPMKGLRVFIDAKQYFDFKSQAVNVGAGFETHPFEGPIRIACNFIKPLAVNQDVHMGMADKDILIEILFGFDF